MNDDNITIPSFTWENETVISEGAVGITAQELSGLFPTMITSTPTNTPAGTITINTTQYGQAIIGSVGAQGTAWTDPWAEVNQRLAAIEKTIAEEAEIRRQHPAVQNAYDHYRLLLVLAGKISPEDLTEK
jgi:sulfur transfer protein SufE